MEVLPAAKLNCSLIKFIFPESLTAKPSKTLRSKSLLSESLFFEPSFINCVALRYELIFPHFCLNLTFRLNV